VTPAERAKAAHEAMVARFVASATPRDWAEDFPHENGLYDCLCHGCGGKFLGHKRRPMCKECTTNGRPRYT